MTRDKNAVADLRTALGRRNVLTGRHNTKAYRTGYRSAEGECLAVARPGTLTELWRVLQIAVRHDLDIIMQAANTGLTGGSTPHSRNFNEVLIINTNRLRGVTPINNGDQVICFPGSTLHELEQTLKPFARDPHSVIGSSCLGASVIGGVCNNSGGALVERGPAYTEYALYARLDESGNLILENHLGINLGHTPEEILTCLERQEFANHDIAPATRMASDHEYRRWVRDIDAPTPARFNADPRRLKGASGCAGKLAIFAVRLDTFPKNTQEKTFFVGTNTPSAFTDLRRTLLSTFKELPVSAEYMDRGTFSFTGKYGRDTVQLIRTLGTERLPLMYKLKEGLSSRLEQIPFLPTYPVEHGLQAFGRILPNPLPRTLRRFAGQFEHLLILKMKNDGIGQAADLLAVCESEGSLRVHVCNERDARLLALHRFAAAGAAIRFHSINTSKVGDLLSLDIALPRNTTHWREEPPQDLDKKIERKLCYGHFMCQVFHQDYILSRDADTAAVKASLLKRLNDRGAKYPAEHNVGRSYTAETQLRTHYRSLDPRNQLNPGIGKDSAKRYYCK